MLGVKEFKLEEDSSASLKKTTENIRVVSKQILSNFIVADQLNNALEKISAVTDGGSNVVKVFSTRYPCMAHRLNLVLEWTFKEKHNGQEDERLKVNLQLLQEELASLGDTYSDEKRNQLQKRIVVLKKKLFNFPEECPNLSQTITGVKDLFNYFKQSGYNKLLTTSLKQSVPTRWNSHCIMLESYQKSREEVKSILLSQQKLEKLAHINDGSVDNLMEILKSFKECSECWSGEKYPTIQLVAPWVQLLFKQTRYASEHGPEVNRLKLQIQTCMKEYLDLTDLHLAACALDPRYKTMRFYSESQKTTAKRFLKVAYEKVVAEILPDVESIVQTPCEEPAKKKSKFADLQDAVEEALSTSTFDGEFEKYINKDNSEFIDDENFCILTFWKKATDLPNLRIVALRILSIPATQASDERVFSTTGCTINARRSQLSGSTVADLTFINKNYEI